MEIILIENVRNLGGFGLKVKVAKGYARNYLIPTGKAVPANNANLAEFEARRADYEKSSGERVIAAQERAAEISAVHLTIMAKSADEGKLYGSIGTLEISKAFAAKGLDVKRQEVRLPAGPIRELGDFEVTLQLHPEVACVAKIKVVPEQD